MAREHRFGAISKRKILTLHLAWRLMLPVILERYPFDLTIVWAHRGRAAQNKAFAEGTSTKRFPDSLHNENPSRAVDAAPFVEGRIDWGAGPRGLMRYWILAYVVRQVADEFGVEIRWGMDWDGDGDISDQQLMDAGHWEVIVPEGWKAAA